MPKPENIEPYKFAKGQSGNPKGRPPGSKNVSTVLKELLAEIAPGEIIGSKFVKEFCKGRKRVTNAEAVAARLLKAGIIDGEGWAIKEISDRTEGKAMQSLEMTGKDGGPIQTENVQPDLSKLSTEELLALREINKKLNH